MRHRRLNRFNSTKLYAVVAMAGFTACADQSRPAPTANPDDPLAYDEASLTPLATACTFNSTTGLMTVVLADGETAIISKRAADSGILQNGVACNVLATSTSLKKIAITGSTGANTVILDFTNGLYALGTSSATTSGISVDLGAGTDVLAIKGTTGDDSFVFGAGGMLLNTDNNKDVVPANIESYVLSLGDGADTYSGAGSSVAGAVFPGPIAVYGSAGNDTFNQGALATPSESIYGGSGTDTVSYASRTAALTVTLGAGANDGLAGEADNLADDLEVVTGGTGDDTFTAAAAVAITFNGGAGADTLEGSSADDTLNGGAGADTLRGKEGDDTLNGDDGDDSFDEEDGSVANGADVFNGGAGVDTVDYSARTADLAVTMDGVDPNDGESGEGDNVKSDVENVKCGAGDDTVTGNTSHNNIWGGDGDDTLTGGAGDDVFVAEAATDGDDVINGGTGSDTVDYSGRTNDITAVLDGTAGSGESGESDTLGSDVENLWGGDGDDTLTGNSSSNELVGGVGDDTLDGDTGDDTLEGGGGSENNVLTCGDGIDIAFGEGSAGSKTDCEI